MMIDDHSRRGQKWLESLLQFMGLPTTVSVQEVEGDDEHSWWLVIDERPLTPEQINILTGPKGTTLDTLQYLANTIVHIEENQEFNRPFTVEVNGYRLRRQAELRILAKQIAQEVRETRRSIEMTDLSSSERRQIHNFLKDTEDVETESRGQEPDRKLVVRPRYMTRY